MRKAGLVAELMLRTKRDHLAQDIERFVTNASTESDIIQFVCKTITRYLGWKASIFWKYDATANLMVFSDSYSTDDPHARDFVSGSSAYSFTPGTGIPGRAFKAKRLTWLDDVQADGTFLRRPLSIKTGICTAFSFPIFSGEEVLGCLEFLNDKPEKSDEQLFQIFMEVQSRIAARILYLRAKAELDERVYRLQSIVDGYPSPLIVRNREGAFELVNQAVANSFRLTPREIIGTKVDRFVDPDTATRSNLEDQQVFETGVALRSKMTIRTGDRLNTYLVYRFPVRNLKGDVVSVCTTTTDVTEFENLTTRLEEALRQSQTIEMELQQSERRLKFALEGSSDGMWDWDLVNHEMYVSEKLAKFFGGPQIIKLSEPDAISSVVHPEDIQRSVDSLFAHMQGRTPIHEVEARLRNAAGEYVWMLTRGKVSERDSKGNPTRVTGVHINIQNLKDAQEKLKIAEHKAVEAAKVKAQFLANMSHEIRTPLNAIIGMAGLMLKTQLSNEQKEYAEIIEQAGDSLLFLVNDILDFSKLEAGRTRLNHEPFRLNKLLEKSVEIVGGKAREKNLSISISIAPELPPQFIGDETRLGQVLINFLSNAVKFTPSGRISVRVKPCQASKTHPSIIRLRFEVEDSGIGISWNDQHRLFQPFTQATGAINKKYGGTGLGLSISKKLVTAMKGDIGVISEEGRGSTFWFELPLLISEIKESQTHPSINLRSALNLPPSKNNQAAKNHRHLKVLVADDVAPNRLLTTRLVEILGYQAKSVSNGLEALAALEKDRFDLILMDCEMPEMNGYEATAQIRKREANDTAQPHIPIVALTANAIAGDQQKCLDSGMDDYLSKPIRENALKAVLEKWLLNNLGRRAA